jgi:spore coat protein CotF
MMNCNQTMMEKEQMTDLLCSQKFVTSVYNTFCNEASTPAMRSCLSSILQDEHRIQEEIFNEMSTNGYYQVEPAEDTKLSAEKQKFAQTATV